MGLRDLACTSIALFAVACTQPPYHLVGPPACQFEVPSTVRSISSVAQPGADSSVHSVYLELPRSQSPSRVIVSCELAAEPSVAEQLSASGIVSPLRAERQAESSNLYRIYKGAGVGSWVLVDFDPDSPSASSSAGRIVAHCYRLSPSARDEFSCVRSARRQNVRIEYRFGPSDVSNLEGIDRAIFAMLRPRRQD